MITLGYQCLIEFYDIKNINTSDELNDKHMDELYLEIDKCILNIIRC